MQADFLLMVLILFNTFCGSGEIIAELYLFLLQASFTETGVGMFAAAGGVQSRQPCHEVGLTPSAAE